MSRILKYLIKQPLFESYDDVRESGLLDRNLLPGPIIRDISYGFVRLRNFYGPIVDFLNAEYAGPVEIFTYDFRVGTMFAAEKFIQYVNGLLYKYPKLKHVDVVAHSFGGLVAYTSSKLNRTHVPFRNMICLASPFAGVKEIVFDLCSSRAANYLLDKVYGYSKIEIERLRAMWKRANAIVHEDHERVFIRFQTFFDILPAEILNELINPDLELAKYLPPNAYVSKARRAIELVMLLKPRFNVIGEDLKHKLILINAKQQIKNDDGIVYYVRGDGTVSNSGSFIDTDRKRPNLSLPISPGSHIHMQMCDDKYIRRVIAQFLSTKNDVEDIKQLLISECKRFNESKDSNTDFIDHTGLVYDKCLNREFCWKGSGFISKTYSFRTTTKAEK